jgi:WXXGXW repeat (2 copies)
MYEDFRFGALFVALIFFTSAGPVRADAQTPPELIHFCWTNCFSLGLRNGLYTRTDGTDETWTIERFSSTSVVLHRHSVPVAWNGFSADVTYRGEVSKERLINVSVNGRPVPEINMAWGAALSTLPGSNAERDQGDVDMRAADAPPPLLTEEQAPCTGDGYLWTPGYWAWGGGYYWVPGAWVLPPRAGLLWTPGYWGYAGAVFAFHSGYWGPHVGFYGGVNYGFGYPGVGFVGGRWVGSSFAYNRAVYNVDAAVIHNTYNEAVVDHVALSKVSYNGGPGGITAAASAQERAAAAEPHSPPTALQRQRSHQAAGNPALMARANDGHPVEARQVEARPTDTRPTDANRAAAIRGAAVSAAPQAHGTVAQNNRVHNPPNTATNPANSANPQSTDQPAKPKRSSATAAKPQHPPK